MTRPARFDQDAPAGRSRLHHRRPAGFDQLAQRCTIAHVIVVCNHDFSALRSAAAAHFHERDVERTASLHCDQPIVCADAGDALHAGQEVRSGAMRHTHALGAAGRARGEDQVGHRVRAVAAASSRGSRVAAAAAISSASRVNDSTRVSTGTHQHAAGATLIVDNQCGERRVLGHRTPAGRPGSIDPSGT